MRYFFNLYDDMVVLDEEGVELPTTAAARERAIQTARELACAELLEGQLNLKHRIEVIDEAGAAVDVVHFKDVVEVQS